MSLGESAMNSYTDFDQKLLRRRVDLRLYKKGAGELTASCYHYFFSCRARYCTWSILALLDWGVSAHANVLYGHT